MVILLICALLLQAPSLTLACFGLGGGCCQPTETCAPSVPPCPAPSASYSQVPVPQPCVSQPCPTGSSYGSSYSGSYSAPASSYSAPGSSYGASYGASAPNYAAASNYALTGAQYGLTKTASFLGGASATGISSSASSFASGNSPVVRKVVTMQKSLPETKLTIEEGEKPESIEIIETEPEKSLTDTESQTNSVVETVPEETIKKANIDGETSQAKTQTPVPIVILPLSTSTSAPASETAATAETAPGEETPLSSEYQSSIDSAYEEIASEEEALKKQVKGLSKADKETEITTVPDSEHEHNEELVATSKEPEKPATLIESYQGYYQEPTAEPVPQSQEQSMAGMESGQRVDAPSNSQSGEYVEDTSVPEEPSAEPDGGACNNEELRTIVENALRSEADNLEAARQIEGDASKKFGGRFNAIVSDAEFAYVNWYGKMNCQLRVGNRHSLTWED